MTGDAAAPDGGIEEILKGVRLVRFESRYPGERSDGQQQRELCRVAKC